MLESDMYVETRPVLAFLQTLLAADILNLETLHDQYDDDDDGDDDDVD